MLSLPQLQRGHDRMPENNPQTEDEQKKQTRKILKEAMGTDCEPIQDILMTQLQEALWRPEWRSPEKLQDFAVASIALLRDIKPKDTIEAMLAVQMVSTHHAALECSRRAMHQEQTFDGRSQNLKFAAALMNLYTRQMEALNKHRGKGQQKVTVEHVHVEAGAQAVVGSGSHQHSQRIITRSESNRPCPGTQTGTGFGCAQTHRTR